MGHTFVVVPILELYSKTCPPSGSGDNGLCLPGSSGSKGSVSSGELAPISAGCLGAESVDGCKLSLVVD